MTKKEKIVNSIILILIFFIGITNIVFFIKYHQIKKEEIMRPYFPIQSYKI